MRRGRPTKTEEESRVPKPSPSPLRGAGSDPWAALDSIPASASVPEVVSLDDASVRFPALDDFSLLHDSGSKFAFDPRRDPKKQPARDISQRVTDALADEAFAQSKATVNAPTQQQPSLHVQEKEAKPRPSTPNASKPKPVDNVTVQQSTPQRPSMVSTGTMTSPSPPSSKIQNSASRTIFRFPPSSPDHRSSSQPRASDASETAAAALRADTLGHRRPGFLEHRSRSQILTADPEQTSSSSLEIKFTGMDNSVHRSKSANYRARPSSVQGPSKPNVLRRLSREKSKPEGEGSENPNAPLISAVTGDGDEGDEGVKINSNVNFLKAMEEEEVAKRKEKRHSSGPRHIKRASMPSVSLSGTKNLLTGRFGDAFKRFETNATSTDKRDSSRSPIRGTNDLTPIAGSEATDGRSDDGNDLEETEEIAPEMRRELERRRLSQEERRVADAAAAYRQRLAEGGDSGRGRPGRSGQANNKAFSIQSKVQSLLDESGRASPSPTKTASGYGRFTDSPAPEQQALPPRQTQQEQQHPPRTTSRQPPPSSIINQQPPRPNPSIDVTSNITPSTSRLNPTATTQPSTVPRNTAPPSTHPTIPPKPQTKPQNLRTGDRTPQSPAKPSSMIAKKPLPQRTLQQQRPPSTDTRAVDGPNDDWESNFSKRYPDLAGLEMVETELDGGGGTNVPRRGTVGSREMKVRDV